MLPRLQAMGDRGSLSVLKAFVHPLRPKKQGQAPVIRSETKPGEQVQCDWGEFVSEKDGAPHKLSGFTAVLCSSRLRFAAFVKRGDAPTMIRCLMEACESFAGLPKAALTDRMKSVLLEMVDKVPRLSPPFCRFHGLHRGGATSLHIANPPNEGQDRAHSRRGQEQLLARHLVYRSG